MTVKFFDAIRPELDQVKKMMDGEMRIRAGHVGDFTSLEVHPVDEELRPALVIGSSRLFTKESPQVIPMACVIQFIFLAAQIHGFKRTEGGFPVLVGDYLYTKFFSYLCDYDALQWLEPLSRVICMMNEGGILRQQAWEKSEPVNAGIVELETAELMAITCRIGAYLGGASESQQDILSAFGRNLGMAWGLLQEGMGRKASPYLEQAGRKLSLLAKCRERDMFEQVLHMLAEQADPGQRAIVG